MTKRRPPLTTSEALARIAAQLGGYPKMADVVARSVAQVYAWGNPDTDDDPPLGCAIKLDLAYRMRGGEGHPLLETYAAQLEYDSGELFGREIALSLHLIRVLKENSEAELAIAAAAQPGADETTNREAAAEVRDAIAVLTRTLPLLGAGDERRQTGPPTPG